MDDHYVPVGAGKPVCPVCHEPLIFEVSPGYERNEWVSYCDNRNAQCPAMGLIGVDEAKVVPIERIWL